MPISEDDKSQRRSGTASLTRRRYKKTGDVQESPTKQRKREARIVEVNLKEVVEDMSVTNPDVQSATADTSTFSGKKNKAKGGRKFTARNERDNFDLQPGVAAVTRNISANNVYQMENTESLPTLATPRLVEAMVVNNEEELMWQQRVHELEEQLHRQEQQQQQSHHVQAVVVGIPSSKNHHVEGSNPTTCKCGIPKWSMLIAIAVLAAVLLFVAVYFVPSQQGQPTSSNPTGFPEELMPTPVIPNSSPEKTLNPTTIPTDAPSSYVPGMTIDIPTMSPTSVPTGSPTSVPTGSPISVPTKPSTRDPTNSPTSFPTSSITTYPTSEPTSSFF